MRVVKKSMECPFCRSKLIQIGVICPQCKTNLPPHEYFQSYIYELENDSELSLPKNRKKLDSLVSQSIKAREKIKNKALEDEKLQKIEEEKRLQIELEKNELEEIERIRNLEIKKKKYRKIFIVLIPILILLFAKGLLVAIDSRVLQQGSERAPILKQKIDQINSNNILKPGERLDDPHVLGTHIGNSFLAISNSNLPNWYNSYNQARCFKKHLGLYTFEPDYSQIRPVSWFPPHRQWKTETGKKAQLTHWLSEGTEDNSSVSPPGIVYSVPVQITFAGFKNSKWVGIVEKSQRIIHFTIGSFPSNPRFFFNFCTMS
jgi:hypothetical protein